MRIQGLSVLGLLVLASCAASPGSSDGADAYVGCIADPRVNVPAFPADVSTQDGALALHFLAADPPVPLAGDNTWTVAITTASGGKADVTAVTGAAFMPDHSHASSLTPVATQLPDGAWKIEHVNLAMGGVWRVTLTLKRTSGEAATAVVFVCVAG